MERSRVSRRFCTQAPSLPTQLPWRGLVLGESLQPLTPACKPSIPVNREASLDPRLSPWSIWGAVQTTQCPLQNCPILTLGWAHASCYLTSSQESSRC